MIVFWILAVLLSAYITRAFMGPTIWDRLLGLNLIASKVIVLIIVVASIYDMSFLLDFAIIYALSGFIGIIFLALFFSKSRLDKKREKKDGH
ncbi:MAG: monovalent cation/H+ antiporter complex subunit F [Defluviitaleaceae bacterium]|nr:monovalent cation/H+ antiporter complex subunit F [Defluviitaleaceae bacterium]MCL2239232.1 monovalent cation/H+ antiporter complex subunit F [Defluviitaleaceae bacterium]MCL2239814.1 monovalent cation/H+ antiporter complex subunit F [Defluviitaleaceae bacterium]